MKLKASIVAVIVAVGVSVLVAHYDDFLSDQWHTYSAPDRTFSIELPGQAIEETKTVPKEHGGTLTFHFVNANPTRNRAYTCSYVEIERVNEVSPDQVLESARDGSLRKVGGTIVRQSRLNIQGFPGLQFQAHVRGNSLMDSRMVLVGDRLYTIMAVVTDGRASKSETVQRMFDSFKLDTK